MKSSSNLSVVFASTNRGKLSEMQEIGKILGVEILDPLSFVEQCGPIPDVEEGTVSYQENARLKAAAFFRWCRRTVLADDTGLEVSALDDAPGILSARFAGPHASMQENKEKLLNQLTGFLNRRALFRCTLCLVEDENIDYSEATLGGTIAPREVGRGGFGYDGLFIVDGLSKTLAELKEEKYHDTHRFRAMQNLISKR